MCATGRSAASLSATGRRGRSSRTTSGPRSSIASCPSSTSTRSGRCASSSTPRTAWAGACWSRSSRKLPTSRPCAATSSRTGTFPNHEPNPLLPENREFIVAKTLEEGADLGVAFDGDADRCFFVDDTGEFVPGDFVTALLAESVLEKEPGAKIIYDVRASWAVPETIERAGGIPLINRVGHAFIKHRMRKEDAAFGGEVSGHYYFRDFSQASTAASSGSAHAQLHLGSEGQKLSDALRPFRARTSSPARSTRRCETMPLKLARS